MSKRGVCVVALTAVSAMLAGSSVFADDLTVPVGGMTITSTPASDYGALTVKGPLVIYGSKVSVTNTGVAAIGPDVGDNASVVISNGAWQALKDTITYGGNGGKGGKITVSGDTEMKLTWGGREGGTFGGYVQHTISENLTSDNGVFDLVEMGTNGSFGISKIYTKNTQVKTRLLFNGGALWMKSGGIRCSPSTTIRKSCWKASVTTNSASPAPTVRRRRS